MKRCIKLHKKRTAKVSAEDYGRMASQSLSLCTINELFLVRNNDGSVLLGGKDLEYLVKGFGFEYRHAVERRGSRGPCGDCTHTVRIQVKLV